MSEQLTLTAPEATEAAGRQLARAIIAADPAALCIYLHGELGAGKTTFARGFLRGCGHAGRVPSPTYTLIEPYQCASHQILHMDLYRLQDGAELEFLGIADMSNGRCIQLVEWPERGAGGLHNADLQIFLKVIPEGRACELRAETELGRVVLKSLSSVNT